MGATSFTNIFGGNVIGPSQVSSIELILTSNVVLSWPLETAPNANLAASIIDVTSSGAYSITMPAANAVSNGTPLVMNNLSMYTISVLDASGATICALLPGTIWFLYIRDNSTAQGVWGTFQYGASVSAANAAALAGPGLTAVGALLATNAPVTDIGTNYVVQTTDRSSVINWTGATGTVSLPQSSFVGNGFYFYLNNGGSSNLTLSPFSGDTVSTPTFSATSGALVVSDGNGNWLCIGGTAGSGGGSGFNLLSISLTGLSGTYVLPVSAYNEIGYKFTGLLSGNITVVVPTPAQEYWVSNQTTGGSLSISVSGQATPPMLASGQTGIFYSDGTQIVNAISNTLVIPVPVNQGGTNAITVQQAQINLSVPSYADMMLTAMTFG